MPRTGWRPSGFDGRDLVWPATSTGIASTLLNVPFGPRNQGEANCCVAVAVATGMEILDAQRGEARRLSPLFNYFDSRNDPTYTGDVAIRDALHSALHVGVCRSELHLAKAGPDGPFDRNDALTVPTQAAYADAREHPLVLMDPNSGGLGYFQLDGGGRTNRWRSALANRSPIAFGFSMTQSYRRLLDGETTEIRDVSSDFGTRGHAALAIGFDGNWFRIRDSRGQDFADGGEWLLHANIVERSWVQESWAIATIGYDT